MKKLLYALSCSTALLAPVTANAYLIFFDEDLNSSSPTAALSSTPRSDSASASFRSNLSLDARTEDFENISTPFPGPRALTYTRVTATLNGGNGVARTQTTDTIAQGQYSVPPSPTSTKYWQTEASRPGVAGTFEISFSQPIEAIGFYIVDFGEPGGQPQLELSNNGNPVATLTIDSTEGTDGSVVYYGIIAEDPSEEFTDVTFVTTLDPQSPIDTETFAIDQITVDPVPPNTPLPNPATLALFGLGLAALGWSKRKARS